MYCIAYNFEWIYQIFSFFRHRFGTARHGRTGSSRHSLPCHRRPVQGGSDPRRGQGQAHENPPAEAQARERASRQRVQIHQKTQLRVPSSKSVPLQFSKQPQGGGISCLIFVLFNDSSASWTRLASKMQLGFVIRSSFITLRSARFFLSWRLRKMIFNILIFNESIFYWYTLFFIQLLLDQT